MKIPSETVIEAALSEIKSHAAYHPEGNDGREKHEEQCEFCLFVTEVEKRNEMAGEGSLCQIDKIVYEIVQGDMMLHMLTSNPMTGPGLVNAICMIGRSSFLVGMKSALSQAELSKLEDAIGDIKI